MLKKINRGLKRADFEKSLEMGKLFQSPLFAVSVISLKPEDQIAVEGKEIRFGFIVSKKLSKLAIKRNRVKRLLAEASRKNLEYLEPGKFKIIFLARKAVFNCKADEVQLEVKKVFEKISTFK